MSCFLSLPSFYGQSSSLSCTRSWSYCSSLVSCTVKPNSSASSRSAYTAKYSKEIIIITELTSFNLNSWPRTSNAPLILPGNHYNISLIHLLCRYSRWPSHLIPFLQAPITLTLLPVLPDKKRRVNQMWILTRLHHHSYLPPTCIPSHTAFLPVLPFVH